MPSPSYWPFVLALGLPIMGYGFVFKYWWLLAVGVLITFFGITDGRRADDRARRRGTDAAPTDGAGCGHQRGVEPDVVARDDTTPAARQTNTGVSNNKLAIWVFLASESLFFGAFIATYFLYRGRDAGFSRARRPTTCSTSRSRR